MTENSMNEKNLESREGLLLWRHQEEEKGFAKLCKKGKEKKHNYLKEKKEETTIKWIVNCGWPIFEGDK